MSKSSVGWKWPLPPQTSISRISGADISTSSVYAVLIQLLLYFTGELSYQHHSKELLNYLWSLVPWIFIYFSYLTSGNKKKNLCLQLVLCLKGCKVKGVNVRFIRNTSLFSWIENQAKCFQGFLSGPKSTHHSLLQFRYVSVNCIFFGVFLNLSRPGRESWGLNVDVAGGYFWEKLQHHLYCCNLIYRIFSFRPRVFQVSLFIFLFSFISVVERMKMRGREQFRGFIIAVVVTRCLNEVLALFRATIFSSRNPNDPGAERDHPIEGLSSDHSK